MIAIYKKEIKMFFNTVEGYVAISVFLILNTLILWYIPSDLNIFHNNQSSLLPFFSITPWVFLILIPAITMKMISSEITQKTTIILFTKPIKKWEIIVSKFFASFTIGIISIIPTLIFVYSLYHISDPKGNIDGGELIGSYIGVIMLLSVYSSIGLFCSSISSNIMVSFISTIIIILFFLFGLELLGNIYNSQMLEYLSINSHYESISRGVIDSRDIIYFTSLTICFLHFSTFRIQNNNR